PAPCALRGGHVLPREHRHAPSARVRMVEGYLEPVVGDQRAVQQGGLRAGAVVRGHRGGEGTGITGDGGTHRPAPPTPASASPVSRKVVHSSIGSAPRDR